MRKLVTLIALCALTACGSAEKNAKEKLENGEFDASAAIYERILKTDPRNGDAIEGLKRARAGILSNRLIDVRKQREAGSTPQALETLYQVVQSETQWGVMPPAAARYTQDEETAFAWKPFRASLESDLAQGKPLLADYRWKRYEPVFSGEKLAKDFQALKPKIMDGGKRSCRELGRTSNGKTPFYGAFLLRYCRYWKQDAKNPFGATLKGQTSQLYSGLDWKGQIGGLPAADAAVLRKNIEEAFKASAWYDPNGSLKAEALLNGAYASTHDKNLVSLVHSYIEDEPYPDVEAVQKTRQVPYVETVNQFDSASGTYRSLPVTRYRTETYTENQSVVRHRNVEKQYPYSAIHHVQTLAFDGTAILKVGAQSFTVVQTEQARAEGDEHNLTVDAVGLKPSKPNLIPERDWVAAESEKMKKQAAQKLSEEWVAQVCNAAGAPDTIAELGDLVQKCKRDPYAANSPFVNDWYLKTFGLAQSAAESLLVEKKQ